MLVRILLALLSLFVGIMAMAIILSGAEFSFGFLRDHFGLPPIDLGGFSLPFIDGTLRFFAVFLLVFALFCADVVVNYNRKSDRIPLLMGIMIAGGCARIASIFLIGDQQVISYVAAFAEIVPALLVLSAYFATRRRR